MWSADQDIRRLLRTPKFHFHVHNSLPLDRIMSKPYLLRYHPS